MAASGKTPILLYGSTTPTNAPSAGNLTNSSDGCEIAINVADKNLFFKDSTNVVNTVPIRQSGTSSNGWLSSTDWNTFNNKASAFTYTTNYVPYGQGTTTPTQSANLTFNGTQLSAVRLQASGDYASNGGDLTLTNTNGGRSWRIGDGIGGAVGSLVIWDATAGAIRTYFDSAGNQNLSNGNLVIGTSGKGIDFSATAGTGTSELLADYEEGTWTPVLDSATAGSGRATTVNSATYTKVGRQVSVQCYIKMGTLGTGGSGAWSIKGLPYTSKSSSYYDVARVGYAATLNAAVANLGGYIYPSSTTITMTGSTGASTLPYGELDFATYVKANTELVISATYFV